MQNLKSPLAIGLLISSLLMSSAGFPHNAAFASHQLDGPTALIADLFLCYIETNDGSVLDLNRLCQERGAGERTVLEALSAKDQQFIEEYLGLLMSSPTLDPKLAQAAQSNPSHIVQTAMTACNALRTGTESRLWANERLVDRDTLISLSTEYYCREFAD